MVVLYMITDQFVKIAVGRPTMRIHVIQTGTVAIKQQQVHGIGHGFQRRLNTLLDSRWTEPLPISVWVIHHPEGVISVDTGETARAKTRVFSLVARRPRL